MDNNTTNINKANNHLSPQIIEYEKGHDIYVRNPDPDLGQAHTCGRIKLLNGMPTLPSS